MSYFIIPITDAAVQCPDYTTASREAQYRAETDNHLYAVVHAANAAYFPPPEQDEAEHVRNGVTPGLDFPATLY